MYIPSIYKSFRVYIMGIGNNTITATDINYTRLTVTGMQSGNQTGFSGVQWLVDQNSPTNINVAALAPSVGGLISKIVLNVEENIAFFYKQPFHHGAVIIDTQQLNGAINTGKTYGPKAFIVSRGGYYTLGRNPDGREITESQTSSTLWLEPTTGVVTASRLQVDYPSAPGQVFHYFTIIDPW